MADEQLPKSRIETDKLSFTRDANTSIARRVTDEVGSAILTDILDASVPAVDLLNSSSTPLAGGAVFTGQWVQRWRPELIFGIKADQNATIQIQFSVDGVNIDSSLSYSFTVDVPGPPHSLVIARQYYRVVVTNTSVDDMTFMRLQTSTGKFGLLTAPVNASIAQDADAILTRVIESEIDIAQGKYFGYSITNKFGTNSDIDSGSVPEDIWEVGGTYTGWATNAETVQVFSSDANDTSAGTGARSVRIIGLDADYNQASETVELSGLTPVVTINTFIRVHSATVITAGSGGVNVGVITFRQSTTVANVFLSIVIGRNQSNAAVFTIPAGYTGYLRTLHCAIRSNTATALDGVIWTRPFGGVFRSRRPFTVTTSFRLYDVIYGGLVFTEKSDLTLRVISCTSNNTPVNGGFDLLLVKN